MKIYPNPELEAEIYDKLRTTMSAQKQRDAANIHASDLTYLRKAYWQRVAPLPPTNDEIGYWLSGLAHHYFLVYAQCGVDDTQEESFFDKDMGIWYSPDLASADGEFKTSRAWKIPEGPAEAKDTFSYYFKQCRIYAAARKKPIWNLYVLFLSPNARPLDGRKVPRLPVWTLHFTEEELAEERLEVKRQVKQLREALATKDPSSLPLCSEGVCFKLRGRGAARKPVPQCKWWDSCRPEGRYVND